MYIYTFSEPKENQSKPPLSSDFHPPQKNIPTVPREKTSWKKILKTSVHTKPTSKTQASSSGTLESNGQTSPKTTPSENDHMVGGFHSC